MLRWQEGTNIINYRLINKQKELIVGPDWLTSCGDSQKGIPSMRQVIDWADKIKCVIFLIENLAPSHRSAAELCIVSEGFMGWHVVENSSFVLNLARDDLEGWLKKSWDLARWTEPLRQIWMTISKEAVDYSGCMHVPSHQLPRVINLTLFTRQTMISDHLHAENSTD